MNYIVVGSKNKKIAALKVLWHKKKNCYECYVFFFLKFTRLTKIQVYLRNYWSLAFVQIYVQIKLLAKHADVFFTANLSTNLCICGPRYIVQGPNLITNNFFITAPTPSPKTAIRPTLQSFRSNWNISSDVVLLWKNHLQNQINTVFKTIEDRGSEV